MRPRATTMGSMTGIIPTVDQIEALHRKLAPSDAAYDSSTLTV